MNYFDDKVLENCFDYLDTAMVSLNKINIKGEIGILGTTLNASFANSILGEKVNFFVDENTNKVDSVSQGKKVIHPKSLNGSETIIIPYGKSGESIYHKLQSKYKNNFICI